MKVDAEEIVRRRRDDKRRGVESRGGFSNGIKTIVPGRPVLDLFVLGELFEMFIVILELEIPQSIPFRQKFF